MIRLLPFFMAVVVSAAEPLVAGTLSGRVIDAETANPIRDVTIRILNSDRGAITDRQGEFRIGELADSTFQIVATHVGYDRSDTLIATTAGADITISLRPVPWVMNSVVVTGTRSPHLLKDVPVQTEVISQRDFQRTGATTVDEALASSVGIQINEDLSGQGATIRGIEGDRVLVLVDGQRAVGRVRGSLDLGQFSLNNVNRIEVVKGTGSTLYGSDAIGGVINIITNRPEIDSYDGKVLIDYGSYNTFNPSAEITLGSPKWRGQVGGEYYSTDGFDLIKETPHTNGEDAVKRWNFDGKVSRHFGERISITGSTRFMHENKKWIESEVKGIRTYAYDDREANNRYEGSLQFDYLSGDKYRMNLRAYGTIYDHNWNKFAGGYWLDTANTDDQYFELAYSSNYVIGAKHVATYGLDYTYQNLKSDELWQNAQADQSGDAYFQYEYSPIRQLHLVPGVRYEDHRNFGSSVNPAFNAMYAPGGALKIRGYVGRGFRVPSIKEQYFIFDHSAAGYVVYGSLVPLPDDLNVEQSDFQPMVEERSMNSSISTEFSYGSVGMHRLTYFYNHLEDLIDFKLIGFSDTYTRGIYVYQNIARAITQGLEWESRVRPTSWLDVSMAYTYLYSRNLDTAYNYYYAPDQRDKMKLINRPDHTLKFSVTGHWDRLGAGATFWGNYESRKLWSARDVAGGNGFAEYTPHRTTLNMSIQKRWGRGVESFVRLENILDEVDAFYGYWPGFTVSVGMKYQLDLTSVFGK